MELTRISGPKLITELIGQQLMRLGVGNYFDNLIKQAYNRYKQGWVSKNHGGGEIKITLYYRQVSIDHLLTAVMEILFEQRVATLA